MCMYNALKRCGAFVAASVLCFALSVPALADEVLYGDLAFYSLIFSSSWTPLDNPVVLNSASDSIVNVTVNPGAFSRFAWHRLAFYGSSPPDISAEGVYGVYVSGFYFSGSGAKQNHAPARSDFSLFYHSSATSSNVSVPVHSVKLFEPSISANSKSDGVTIVARFTQSKADKITNPIFYNGTPSLPSWTFDCVSGNFNNPVVWRCTNCRYVSTSSNAELDALESMASEIANQSQILSQFYGDLVAVCNQIYQRLGDLQAAQEEANALFSNVIELLKTTNGKIEAINMAMSTYFELLINQLKQEGIDIRTAIADAEARLELYLKPMIDYFNELEEQTGESASTLPQHKQDIDGFNNQGFGIDSDGQTGVAALVPILSAFGWIWSIIALFIGVGLIHILVKKGIG